MKNSNAIETGSREILLTMDVLVSASGSEIFDLAETSTHEIIHPDQSKLTLLKNSTDHKCQIRKVEISLPEAETSTPSEFGYKVYLAVIELGSIDPKHVPLCTHNAVEPDLNNSLEFNLGLLKTSSVTTNTRLQRALSLYQNQWQQCLNIWFKWIYPFTARRMIWLVVRSINVIVTKSKWILKENIKHINLYIFCIQPRKFSRWKFYFPRQKKNTPSDT